MQPSTETQNQLYSAIHKPSLKEPWECTQEFVNAMACKNIHFQGQIIADGRIHRFASKGKRNKDCWYVFYGTAGAFGDWSQNIQEKWSLKNDNAFYQNHENLGHHIEKAQKALDEEISRKHEEAAQTSLAQWESFSEVGQSPYLTTKKIAAFGTRFYRDSLIVPVKDITGKLWSFQSINSDGMKRFLMKGRKKGCFHHMGVFKEGEPIYVTEGYATGASVYMATHQTTVIAFDANNLDPVVETLQRAHPRNPIIIAGDDDVWSDHNKGREKAEQAAYKYGCAVVFPKFNSKEGKPTDFNDLHISEGIEEVKRQLSNAQSLSKSEDFLDLLPVNSDLLPVLPFTLDMLPEPLQPWVKDIAHRRQCPLDFVAIPAVLMFASLIGARCSIQPHEKDDWTVVPNLWGGILGDPGTLKSPVCGEVLLPLGYLEAKAMEDFNDKKTKYEVENTAFLEARGALERKIKDVMKQEGSAIESDIAFVKEELSSHLKNSPSEPSLKRYKVSDTTVEKMQEILAQNPGGVLVFREELMGFLESWEKKGHESDRSFYLEAWNGNNSFKMDRIGRGAVHAENICVSILGTTQPDKISTYLHTAIKKLDNDGLLQRFQLLVYPDKKPWKLVDEYPNSAAKNRVLEICKTIDALSFTDYGAQTPELLYKGQFTIPFFRLSADAQVFFHDWLKTLQEKLESKDHPIIIQHLSKYRSLMPSLALIFYVIDRASGSQERNITLSCVQKAAAWCAYLESHARRIYGMVLDTTFEASPVLSKAEELLAWMRKQSTSRPDQALKHRFILRYSKFRSSKELDPLLSDLLQMGYIQEKPQGTFYLAAETLLK